MAGIRISALNTVNLQPEDKFPVARTGNTYAVEGRELLDRFSDLDSRIRKLSGDSSIIDNSELSAMPAFSVKANQFNESAQPQDLRALEPNTILIRPPTGFMTFGKLSSDFIVDNSITNTKLRDSAALSVIGRSANTVGDPSDISGAANQVLRVSQAGLSLEFGAINLASSSAVTGELQTVNIANNAVSNTKLSDMAANTVKVNNTNASADPTDLTLPLNTTLARSGANLTSLSAGINTVYLRAGGNLNFLNIPVNSTLIRAGADLQTITFPSNSTLIRAGGDLQTLTYANNSTIVKQGTNPVSNLVLGTHSVLGRSATDVEPLTAATNTVLLRDNTNLRFVGGTANNQVLRFGTTGVLGFGQINLASPDAVTNVLPISAGGTGQTTYSNGQLLIGNLTGTLTKGTLTAGTGISVTNGDGSVTITNTAPASLIPAVPVGSIVAYAGNNIPSGWLECNGQTTSGYSSLALVVGSSVPDLRGYFIRGLGINGDGVTQSGSFKATQKDAFQGHEHSFKYPKRINASSPGSPATGVDNTFTSAITTAIQSKTEFGTARVADETRPKNIALYYIIKA